MNRTYKEIADAIRQAKKICVFTGAGISCPSGIPDFRSAEGLYHQKEARGYSPEEIISHDFLTEHPGWFYEFYKEKMLYPKAKPNDAHLFFARMEKQGRDVSVVTQNIDGLHQMAGSTNVYEIHGSAHRNYCTHCLKRFPMEYILASEGIPCCDRDGAIVRPEVVLYGEGLPEETVEKAIRCLEEADLLFIVGTSLAVYPAASFLQFFHGDRLVLLNKGETPYDQKAQYVIREDVALAVREIEKYL